jgi:importin subunit beta-1
MGMKHSDECVSLQAVELWSTVCKEEVELVVEAQEVHFENCVFSGDKTDLGV